MSGKNELFRLNQEINNLSFSEDTISFASNCLPLIKQFLAEIPNVKFNRSDISVNAYNKSLKELGTFILDNYTDSLRLFMCLSELSNLFKRLEHCSSEIKIKEAAGRSPKEDIIRICQRHYLNVETQALTIVP